MFRRGRFEGPSLQLAWPVLQKEGNERNSKQDIPAEVSSAKKSYPIGNTVERGASALIGLIPDHASCTPMFKAFVRCGEGLDKLQLGQVERGLYELGFALGALRVATVTEDNSRDSNRVTLIASARDSLGDSILHATRFALGQEPNESLKSAFQAFELSAKAALSATQDRVYFGKN